MQLSWDEIPNTYMHKGEEVEGGVPKVALYSQQKAIFLVRFVLFAFLHFHS